MKAPHDTDIRYWLVRDAYGNKFRLVLEKLVTAGWGPSMI